MSLTLLVVLFLSATLRWVPLRWTMMICSSTGDDVRRDYFTSLNRLKTKKRGEKSWTAYILV